MFLHCKHFNEMNAKAKDEKVLNQLKSFRYNYISDEESDFE